MTMMNTDQ